MDGDITILRLKGDRLIQAGTFKLAGHPASMRGSNPRGEHDNGHRAPSCGTARFRVSLRAGLLQLRLAIAQLGDKPQDVGLQLRVL